jgi:hypothetical protein
MRVDHLLVNQGFNGGDLIKKPKVGVVNSKILRCKVLED